MKKTFLSLLMLTLAFTFTSSAFDKEPVTAKALTSKIIPVSKKYASLIVQDVNIVLTNDEAGGIRIEGDADAVKSIHISDKPDELRISGKSRFARKDRVTVYVPASMINNLELYGASTVSSKTPLNNLSLYLYVDSHSKARLKSFGAIKIGINENADYKVEGKVTVPASK